MLSLTYFMRCLRNALEDFFYELNESNPMDHSDLSSLIWSSADDVLRGVFKPSEYGRIILSFVVFRRLDCVLEPRKDEICAVHEKLKDDLQDTSPVIRKQIDKRMVGLVNDGLDFYKKLENQPETKNMIFQHLFSDCQKQKTPPALSRR